MDVTTSPNAMGPTSDDASEYEHTAVRAGLTIIRARRDGKHVEIYFTLNGKHTHQPVDALFWTRIKAGAGGFMPEDAESFKRYLAQNGFGSVLPEGTGIMAEAQARAETSPPAEGHPKWMDTMHSRIEDPDSMDDPAAPEIHWPEGGSIPITGRDFTEERAIELGIVHEDDRGKMRVSVHEAARYIMERVAFANVRTGDNIELYFYDQGTYHRQGDVWVSMAAERLLGQYATNKNVAEILGKIKRTIPPTDTDDQNPEGWICVKNGYLNIFTRELEPHHPGRIFTTQVQVIFAPSKKCQHWGRFLLEVTDLPTDPQAIMEMMGYCLMPGYPYQYLFILLGEGSNGKGVLLRVLTSILGEANVSHVTLHDLATRPFAPSQLYHKMANLPGEISAAHLKDTTIIKACVGEDRIMGDRKNRDALNFVNQAKMIAACNKIPYSQDDTYGFVRRPRVFLFPRQFKDDKKDPKLTAKLTTEDEKSAIFNEMLNGLDRLVKQGHLTGRQDELAEAERYVAMQNPAAKFLNENVVADTQDSRFKEDYNELYDQYVQWCEDNGFPKSSKNEFEKEVVRVFQDIAYVSKWGKRDAFDNPEGKTGRCWVGIRFEPQTRDS